MSIHKSLVPASKLKRHRNVLTRAERLEILLKENRWQEGQSLFGLPKVKNIKIKAKAKVKKAETAAVEGAEAAAPGTTPAAGTPTPAGKGAPPTATAAKGTVPAKGTAPAKSGAPAAKEEKKK